MKKRNQPNEPRRRLPYTVVRNAGEYDWKDV